MENFIFSDFDIRDGERYSSKDSDAHVLLMNFAREWDNRRIRGLITQEKYEGIILKMKSLGGKYSELNEYHKALLGITEKGLDEIKKEVQAQAEAQAKAQAKAEAQAEAQAKAQAEAQAKAKSEAERKRADMNGNIVYNEGGKFHIRNLNTGATFSSENNITGPDSNGNYLTTYGKGVISMISGKTLMSFDTVNREDLVDLKQLFDSQYYLFKVRTSFSLIYNRVGIMNKDGLVLEVRDIIPFTDHISVEDRKGGQPIEDFTKDMMEKYGISINGNKKLSKIIKNNTSK